MSKHQEIHLQTLMLQDPKVSNPMGDACSIEDVLESYQGMDDIDLLKCLNYPLAAFLSLDASTAGCIRVTVVSKVHHIELLFVQECSTQDCAS